MENDQGVFRSELLSMVNDVLTTEKLTVYLDVMKLFTSFTDPKVQRQVKQNPKKQEGLAQQMTKIGMLLALLGADAVVKGYVEFREMAQMGGESKDIVRCFGDLILKMREDLHGAARYGTPKDDYATVDDMLGSFIVGGDS